MNHLAIKCDKCHKNFLLFENGLKEVKVLINNRTLFLNYFLCTNCHSGYFVCVKDTKYFELKEKEDSIVRDMKNLQDVKDLTTKMDLIKSYDEIKARIRSHFQSLNKRIVSEGTFAFDYLESTKEVIIKYLPKEKLD